MLNSTKDAALLRQAADYIRDRGWTTGRAGGYGEPACMAGAIRTVIRWDTAIRWDSDLPDNNVRKWVLLVCGTRAIVEFNDEHCLDSRDAIAALEIAADLAEAGWDQ